MHDAEVSFGGIAIRCSDYEITSRINAMPEATLRFDGKQFQEAGVIPYLAEVNVRAIKSDKQLFKGNIVSVSHTVSTTEVKLEGGVELTDMRHAGIAVTNISVPELFYSFTRLAGIPHERLVVEGLDDLPKGFVAFIPIKGLKVKEKRFFGDIEIIDAAHLKSKVTPGSDKELWDGLFNGDSWLVVTAQAAHFIDAEEMVLEEANSFLALYSAALQFSYSKFDNEAIDWHRGRETQNIKRLPYILLVCMKGLGSWLRSLEPAAVPDKDFAPQIRIDFTKALAHEQYKKLPILLWDRLRDSEDYYIVTMGIWQVLEVLCAKVKLPRRLSKSQAAVLRQKIEKIVNKREYEILDSAISNANLMSLSDKLDKLLADLGIELSHGERKLLVLFRKIRNDIEHGRKSTIPTANQVKQAKALVNRVLLEVLEKSNDK